METSDCRCAMEHFRFGDVGQGVEIEQIARRAVGLVAGQKPWSWAHRVQTGIDILDHHVRERFPIIAFDARPPGVGVPAEERGQFVLQTIAAPALELREQIRRPTGFVFVRVLIKGARLGAGVIGKGFVKPRR